LSIFLTHFLSRNLVLYSEFQTSIISWSFPNFSGFREIFWKWLFFGQFQHIRHHIHSILVKELDFNLRFKKKQYYGKFTNVPKFFGGFKFNYFFLKIWVENQVPWLKLSRNDAPYVEIGQKQSFPEDFPKSRKFREISRNDWILKFRVQNQVPWQKMSGKNTQYIEISRNQPDLGQCGILGFGIPRSKKLRRSPKVPQIIPYILQGSFL
jgi:hypothetical protein